MKQNINFFHKKIKVLLSGIKMSIGELQKIESTKLLGVIIDESLTFKDHVDYLRMKITQWVGILHKLNFILLKEIAVKLYKFSIESSTQYGLEVRLSGSKNLTNEIFVLQKNTIRAIRFFFYQTTITPQSSWNPRNP